MEPVSISFEKNISAVLMVSLIALSYILILCVIAKSLTSLDYQDFISLFQKAFHKASSTYRLSTAEMFTLVTDSPDSTRQISRHVNTVSFSTTPIILIKTKFLLPNPLNLPYQQSLGIQNLNLDLSVPLTPFI